MESPVTADSVTVNIEVLRALIKESVREVIQEERLNIWRSAVPETEEPKRQRPGSAKGETR